MRSRSCSASSPACSPGCSGWAAGSCSCPCSSRSASPSTKRPARRCSRSCPPSPPARGGRRNTETCAGGPPPAHVSVLRLPPRAGGDGGQDREQRRAGRFVLGEAERDEHGHEQDPAAHPEHPGEHAGEDAEQDRERIAHLTNSQTAMPRSSTANSSSTVFTCSRCCNAVPPTAPTAAGSPTSAA